MISSFSVDISSQLHSKVDRNGDEMYGDLQINGFKITGLPTNINLITDNNDTTLYSVCNERAPCTNHAGKVV